MWFGLLFCTAFVAFLLTVFWLAGSGRW